MAELNADMKDKITEELDATRLKRRGFTVSYEATDVLATITRFEHRFVIASAENRFRTTEYPGLASHQPETIDRSDFEACVLAIRHWVDRVIDREEADILDQFGGVADRMI